MSSEHQERARWRKAVAIADYLERIACAASTFDRDRPEHWESLLRTAQGTPDADWRAIAVAAGQRPPSAETQRIVIEIIRGRQQAAGQDPFARFA